jgi:hypothetical protein
MLMIYILSVEPLSDEVLAEHHQEVDPTPPVLPAPQIDLSISMESILEASVTCSETSAMCRSGLITDSGTGIRQERQRS